MTKKQKKYKHLCRIKVTYYSKLITWLLVIVVSMAMPELGLPTWVELSLPITLWFWVPTAIAFVLETRYKLTHTHQQ